MLELLYIYPDGRCIVKLDDKLYFFGNDTEGFFGWTPDLWLKSEPDIPKAKKEERIPDGVLDFLEAHADESVEIMANLAKQAGTYKISIHVDGNGKAKRVS